MRAFSVLKTKSHKDESPFAILNCVQPTSKSRISIRYNGPAVKLPIHDPGARIWWCIPIFTDEPHDTIQRAVRKIYWS